MQSYNNHKINNNDLPNANIKLLKSKRKIKFKINVYHTTKADPIHNQTTNKNCNTIKNSNNQLIMPILNENNNKIKLKHVRNTENELLNEIKKLKLKDYKSSTYLYYDYMKLIYAFIRGRHPYYTNYLDYDMKKNYAEDRQSELSNLISKYSEKYYDYYKEIGYKNNILKNISYPVLQKEEFKTNYS